MKILCLYNNDCAKRLFSWLAGQGHEVLLWSDKLDKEWCLKQNFDLAISYTYSFIIKDEVLAALKNNVVNIHNSYLPFNRGVDPNIWSILENTPRGVTLHYIDSGLDKGYIIAQEIDDSDISKDTLRTSYNRLDDIAFAMFKKAFKYYTYWPEMKKKAEGKGTYHTDKQGLELRKYIDSFDMSITDFIERII